MKKKAEKVSQESVQADREQLAVSRVEAFGVIDVSFAEAVACWLWDARAVQAVLDRGDPVSPGEVQRLMTQAIPMIERLRGDTQG